MSLFRRATGIIEMRFIVNSCIVSCIISNNLINLMFSFVGMIVSGRIKRTDFVIADECIAIRKVQIVQRV